MAGTHGNSRVPATSIEGSPCGAPSSIHGRGSERAIVSGPVARTAIFYFMPSAGFLPSSMGFASPSIAFFPSSIAFPASPGAAGMEAAFSAAAGGGGGGGGGGASFFAHAARPIEAANTRLRNIAQYLRIFYAPFLTGFIRLPDTISWRIRKDIPSAGGVATFSMPFPGSTTIFPATREAGYSPKRTAHRRSNSPSEK